MIWSATQKLLCLKSPTREQGSPIVARVRLQRHARAQAAQGYCLKKSVGSASVDGAPVVPALLTFLVLKIFAPSLVYGSHVPSSYG